MPETLTRLPPNQPDAPVQAAHDRVYRGLRQQIMHGELPPGHALTLRGIGKAFGVSMTPAREAVRRLSAEGALSVSASGRVTTPELSNDRIEELAQIRALLEPELGSRALRRAHLALIDRMDAINEANARAVNLHQPVNYIRTNLEFHRTLYLRAQSPAILGLLETVWLQLGPTMRMLYTRLRRTTPPPHHRHILEALRAGDDAALRLAIRTDVTQGLKHLQV